LSLRRVFSEGFPSCYNIAGMQRRTSYNRTEYGFAMISVLLMIMIFFMITVAISSIVVLQARSIYETTITDLSFYVADSGIRYAIPDAMYRFLMSGPAHASLPPGKVSSKEVSLGSSSGYKAKIIFEIYATEALVSPLSGYTHRNLVACNARIYKIGDESMLVAQRCIFADIYLGDQEGTATADPPPSGAGKVRATVKKYYERSR